jgi:hypothetical protein
MRHLSLSLFVLASVALATPLMLVFAFMASVLASALFLT